MEVFKEFCFEAAHWLPGVPPTHKCHRLHGHSYRLRVIIRGDVSSETGFVIDFADIKSAVKPTLDRVDHHLLNEVEGLSNPTSEVLVRWLWSQLLPALPGLARLELWETVSAGCSYSGS